MDPQEWPFTPGSRGEHEYLLKHAERVKFSPNSRDPAPFLVLNTRGLYELATKLRGHLPAALIAIEAVRHAITTGKPLVIAARTRNLLRLSEQQTRTAVVRLAEHPRWFSIKDRGRGRASHVYATNAGIALLHRSKR
jgi:hypothetical protein